MNWDTVELATVADINPRMPRGLSDDLGATFLPMAAVSEDGQIDYQEERTVGEVRKGYTYFRRGDVLVAKITPCFENGKATKTEALEEEHGFGSTEFHVIRGNPDELLPQYAFHLIWNPYFRKEATANMTGSAGQKRVPADFLKRLKIPLPPIDEQRRIAGILDAADALRRRRREALAVLDTLPGAIFADMFGDEGETYTLKQAGTEFRYGTSSKSQDHGVPVLRIPNVIGGDVDLTEIKTVPLSSKEEARFALKDGDIVLVRTNGNQAYVGRSAVFMHAKITGHELADATWSFASYLIRARLKEKQLLPDFVQGFLSSAEGRKQLLASSKTSAGQYNINTESLGAIRVPKVLISQQSAFVDRVVEIKKRRSQITAHLTELETLFASLQSRAFAGAL